MALMPINHSNPYIHSTTILCDNCTARPESPVVRSISPSATVAGGCCRRICCAVGQTGTVFSLCPGMADIQRRVQRSGVMFCCLVQLRVPSRRTCNSHHLIMRATQACVLCLSAFHWRLFICSSKICEPSSGLHNYNRQFFGGVA